MLLLASEYINYMNLQTVNVYILLVMNHFTITNSVQVTSNFTVHETAYHNRHIYDTKQSFNVITVNNNNKIFLSDRSIMLKKEDMFLLSTSDNTFI